MTVLFAVLTATLVAALLYARRGGQDVGPSGDPSQEQTAAWPGVVAGLAALGIVVLLLFLLVPQLG